MEADLRHKHPEQSYITMEAASFAVAAVIVAKFLSKRNAAKDANETDAIRQVKAQQGRFGLAVRHEFMLDFTHTHLNHGSYGTAPCMVVAAARREMAIIESHPVRTMAYWPRH